MNTISPAPGSTIETAIKLDTSCSFDAIQLENLYLSRMFGLEGRDWDKLMQNLIVHEDRHFDQITITVGRRTEAVFFDISGAFPKPTRKKRRARPITIVHR